MIKIRPPLFKSPSLPDDVLSLYRTNRFYYWLSNKCRNPLCIFFVTAFLLFGVLIILNVINGTAINLAIHQKIASTPLIGKLSSAVLSSNIEKQNLQMPLFKDYGSILFAALLYPIHTVLLLRFWDAIPVLFKQLNDCGTLSIPVSRRESLIKEFNWRFNDKLHKLLALMLASAFTLWIYVYGRGQIDWWGKIQYGPWGVLAYASVNLFIWYQLFLHNLKGLVAIKLFRQVFRKEFLTLDLYHPDNCYGLGGLVPKTLMTNYCTTLIHSLSLLIVLQFNFIHKEFNVLLVVLVGIFIIFVPVFHVLPYLMIRRHICDFIDEELSRIRKSARKHYEIIRTGDALSPAYAQAIQGISALDKLYKEIDGMKRHPYGNLRVRVAIFTYVLPLIPIGFKFYEILFPKVSPK